MLFSSITFLWIFLPVTIMLYYGVKWGTQRNKDSRMWSNGVLLCMSLVFYAMGGIAYLILLFTIMGINFYGSKMLDRYSGKKRKNIFVAVILLNFGLLFFFKYMNLFVRIIENTLLGVEQNNFATAWTNMLLMERTNSLPIKDIVLPIGISFYIFQAVSYTADIYMNKVKAQSSIADFALYVSFFPQLIAGPIVQYKDIQAQIRDREENVSSISQGISRFCYGLAKKVIISNTLAEIADEIWALGVSDMGSAVAWLGAISYTLQIYFDFSGYSDMALGLGKIFGFSFKENFNYPYVASSIKEFWRRWHISLSTWFRDYVYIPLGGNRRGKARECFNLFIVFLLTGIWHGANFTFILWGFMYAVLLVMERLFLGKWLNKNPIKILNWLYTMFFVIVGWVLFRSANCVEALQYLKEMFAFSKGQYTIFSFIGTRKIVVLLLALILSTPIYKKLSEKKWFAFESIIQMILLILSIILIISGTYNPFIYFQF